MIAKTMNIPGSVTNPINNMIESNRSIPITE